MIFSLLRRRMGSPPREGQLPRKSVTQLLRELEYRDDDVQESEIVVDLSDVGQITSQELSKIVHLHLAYQDGGKRLVLANATGKVADIIAITRLARTVKVRNLQLSS